MTNEFAIRYASKIGMTVSRLGVPSNGSLTACGSDGRFRPPVAKVPGTGLEAPDALPGSGQSAVPHDGGGPPRSTHVVENSTEKS
jgi:hypothetical protein